MSGVAPHSHKFPSCVDFEGKGEVRRTTVFNMIKGKLFRKSVLLINPVMLFSLKCYSMPLKLLVLFLMITSCRQSPKKWEIHHNLHYGSHSRNEMDVFLPVQRDSTTEVLVLIHGGGWVSGDKGTWRKNFREFFFDGEFAVAAINYRYASGNYHQQMEDIDHAIRFIRAKAEEWNISKHRFGFVGTSAGAHLALLYAHAFDSADVVKAVVSIAGPVDFTDVLFHDDTESYDLVPLMEKLLGNTFDENPQIYREASPLFNYSRIPGFFIHGKLDDLIPFQQSERMYLTLKKAGIPADITILEKADHNTFGPDNIYYDQVCRETKDWLMKYLDK